MRIRETSESFEDFVYARSASLLRTALLLTGQNRAEAEDLLQLAWSGPTGTGRGSAGWMSRSGTSARSWPMHPPTGGESWLAGPSTRC